MAFFAFMFHFYISARWLSILSKAETYDLYVSLLVSIFHTKNTEGEKQKHCGSDSKPLWERFKTSVGAIQKHWGSVKVLPQCFEKWNMKLKMKHKSCMFHFSKWLIFNYFITKNETWKINQRFWKRMDICLINCNLSLSARTYITYNLTYLLHTTQIVPWHNLKHTGYALAFQRTNGLW